MAPTRHTDGDPGRKESIENQPPPIPRDPGKGYADLRRTIDELKSFDVSTIKHRPDPRAKALTDRINNTLANIFGRNTEEYDNYSIWSLDTLPITIGGAWHPLSEVREGYRKGITDAITKLNLLLDKLEKNLPSQEEKAAVPRRQSPPPAPSNEKISLVTMRGRFRDRPSPDPHSHDKQTAKHEKEETVVPGMIQPEALDQAPPPEQVGKPPDKPAMRPPFLADLEKMFAEFEEQEAKNNGIGVHEEEKQATEQSAETAEKPVSPVSADVVDKNAGIPVPEASGHKEVGGSSGVTPEQKTTLEALQERLMQLAAEELVSHEPDAGMVLPEKAEAPIVDEGGAEKILFTDGDDDTEELVLDGDADEKVLVIDGNDQLSSETADELAAGPILLETLEKKLRDLEALESAPETPAPAGDSTDPDPSSTLYASEDLLAGQEPCEPVTESEQIIIEAFSSEEPAPETFVLREPEDLPQYVAVADILENEPCAPDTDEPIAEEISGLLDPQRSEMVMLEALEAMIADNGTMSALWCDNLLEEPYRLESLEDRHYSREAQVVCSKILPVEEAANTLLEEDGDAFPRGLVDIDLIPPIGAETPADDNPNRLVADLVHHFPEGLMPVHANCEPAEDITRTEARTTIDLPPINDIPLPRSAEREYDGASTAPIFPRGNEQAKAPRTDVLDAHIAELRCRIDDLKSFDITVIKERFDPRIKALGDAVSNTLATIFGRNTPAYWQHAIPSLDTVLVVVGGPKPSPDEVRDAYRRGINDAVAKLTATIETLD
ncbi:MAG TPA: hypothetical protein DCZ04_05910, partial [Syntrophorhabdus aromaticivorans]|nr:hypothetical protein [Syntrophorhabdus aromaticivorans]